MIENTITMFSPVIISSLTCIGLIICGNYEVTARTKASPIARDSATRSMASHIKLLEEKVDEIISKISVVEKDNSELKMRLSIQEEQNQQLRQLCSTSQVKTGKKDKSLYQSDHVNSTSHEVQDDFVSFTAYMTANIDYETGSPVIFDGIIANYGEHYNTTTGLFVCPFTGYYLFMLNILAERNSQASFMSASLWIDDDRIFNTYARDTYTLGEATNSAVILCNTDQKVFVQCSNDGNKINGNTARHSTFMGTLLRIL